MRLEKPLKPLRPLSGRKSALRQKSLKPTHITPLHCNLHASIGVLVYRLNGRWSVHCNSQVDQTKRKMNRLCGRLARPTLPCLVRLILMRRDPRHSIRISHFSRPLSRPLYIGLLPVQRVRYSHVTAAQTLLMCYKATQRSGRAIHIWAHMQQ